LDLAIRKHRQAFFNNGAVPGGILTIPKANREQAREVEQRINQDKGGPDNAYKTWVLTGEGTSYVSRGVEAGEKDVDFVNGSGLNRDEVCAVYHVPPGKLLFSGNALGSSGKAEDDATFQEQCVLPLEEAIYEILTRDLLNAEFGMDDIELAPQRRHSLRLDMFDAAEKLVKIGGTGNEARELVNLKKMDDPRFEMDVPMFVGATGGVASDEATPNPTPENETLNQANDQNEVAQKAQARFREGWF
jgi:phage portal protein BeeE